jgi:hypothetical protein
MSEIGRLRHLRNSEALTHARKNLVKWDREIRSQYQSFGAATDFDKQQFIRCKDDCIAKFRILYPDRENPFANYNPKFGS